MPQRTVNQHWTGRSMLIDPADAELKLLNRRRGTIQDRKGQIFGCRNRCASKFSGQINN